jgi:prepilin-type N-terminal cleavage/methylation domain-containing protein
MPRTRWIGPRTAADTLASGSASHGFSLIEALVAMALIVSIAGAIFRLVGQAQRAAFVERQLPDTHQRLRAAAQMLFRDLVSAGAGLNLLPATGTLAGFVPPVRPGGRGPLHPDGDLVCRHDRVTISYRTGSEASAPLERRVYWHDAPGRRLMLYDGGASDLPLVDDISLLQFDYFLDPNPAHTPRPPPGEASCLFGAGTPPVPLLSALGAGSLVRAQDDELADGPMCGTADERFDGDVLRIRLVRVTIGAAVAAGGDVEVVRFDVTPRNLAVRP